MIGTLCVVTSFPFIFLGCIGCNNASLLFQMAYFITFIVVFQFGWAASQVSHLAMIPELTPSQDERTGLIDQTETNRKAHQMSVLDWVKEPQIYQVVTWEMYLSISQCLSNTISEIRRHRHPVVLLSSKTGRQVAPDRQMAPPTSPACSA